MARRIQCTPLAPKGKELPSRHAEPGWQEFEVTYGECVNLIHTARGRKFFLHFGWLAPDRDQTGVEDGSTRGVGVSGNVNLSKRELLRCLANAYHNDNIRFRYTVRITLCDGFFFVGGA